MISYNDFCQHEELDPAKVTSEKGYAEYKNKSSFLGALVKKQENLKSCHGAQSQWITNKLNKLPTTSALFLNADAAERDWSLSPSNSEIEHFVSVHLSKGGVTKLLSTIKISRLRMERKDAGLKPLQIVLSKDNRDKLSALAVDAGKTKAEMIAQLIEDS